MKATIPFILDSFTKFNELCFEGKLPPIPVRLSRARTFLGKVTYVGKRDIFGNVVRFENFCMRISTSFDLSESELEDVVIHEMIHYYIALNRIKDSSTHGEVFKRIMQTLNEKYGRNITVGHHSENGQARSGREESRENFICVTQLKDGKWGITSCSRPKIPDMQRYLPQCYRLVSLQWFNSMDPFFNRYPRSIKPRIYKITREELDAHLGDATPLRCDGRSMEYDG